MASSRPRHGDLAVMEQVQQPRLPTVEARVDLAASSECVSGNVPVMLSVIRSEMGNSTNSVDKGTSPMATPRSVNLSFLPKCEQD